MPAEGAVSAAREMPAGTGGKPDLPKSLLHRPSPGAPTRKGGVTPGPQQGPGERQLSAENARNPSKCHLAPDRITEMLQMGVKGSRRGGGK